MHGRIGPDHPLNRMFAGLVEQVFMAELGICNQQLLDYVSRLLTEFVHTDAIYRLRRLDGQAIHELAQMETDAHLGPDIDPTSRTRVVNLFIGDFTLFWTGVYPEQLRPRHQGADRMREYLLRGKFGYRVASELSEPESEPSPALLRQLSAEFEHCVHGLQRVRDTWELASRSSHRGLR